MDQTPDDIFALYSRFDLDGDNYRVFSRPALSKPQSAPAAPEQTQDPVRPAENHMITTETAETPAGNIGRLGLRNLWQYVAPAVDPGRMAHAESLAAASIAIYGAAGGVGSTTIAAVLARLLAKAGRRCAIFDESDDSALPIYFGAQRIAADHRRFSGLYSVFEPGIKILNREMYEPMGAETPGASGFLGRHCAQLAPHFDHLLFDHKARCLDNVGAGVTIYTAIPDVSSLIGVRKLKDKLAPADAAVNTICVLNRFDPAIPLHREVLVWYRETFKHVVTIHQSPLVPEALAEGTTIVDWAPRTRAAADFLNLFRVVNHLLGNHPHANAEYLEAPGFEAEGLPLCS